MKCGVLLDLDGTLYTADRPIEGAVETVRGLRTRGVAIRALSNTDSIGRESIRRRLAHMGFDIGDHEIVTCVSAAVGFLRQTGARRCLSLVSAEVREELSVFGRCEKQDPDCVIIGDCREWLSYDRLDLAFRALRAGARLVALQGGRFARGQDGDHIDTGAIVAALEYSSGSVAEVIGKPSPILFEQALSGMPSLDPTRVLVVGDDIATDIAGGAQFGLPTVLVATGKFEEGDMKRSNWKPDYRIDSIAHLGELISGLFPGEG